MRAARELRAQQRAVTAEDFENLSKAASRAIARVKCNVPDASLERDPNASPLKKRPAALSPGTVELLVVPAAFDALRAGDLSKLYLEEELQRTALLLSRPLSAADDHTAHQGASLPGDPGPGRDRPFRVQPARGRPGQGRGEPAAPDRPPGLWLGLRDTLGPDWEGWPFGRDLYVSEIYSLIQKVPGVKHVLDVRLSYRQVVPGKERTLAELEALPGGEGEEADFGRARP